MQFFFCVLYSTPKSGFLWYFGFFQPLWMCFFFLMAWRIYIFFAGCVAVHFFRISIRYLHHIIGYICICFRWPFISTLDGKKKREKNRCSLNGILRKRHQSNSSNEKKSSKWQGLSENKKFVHIVLREIGII